jgi:hypothetical protein
MHGCFDKLTASVDLVVRPELADELKFLFRLIEQTLSNTPRTWGDPRRKFRGMNAVLFERSMVSDGLRVEYLVHNSEPVVIVRSISPVEGGPLDPVATQS